MKTRFWQDMSVFGIYALFFTALFWSVASGAQSFAAPDIYPYYHPVWKFASEEIHRGRLPLWNPYLGFGVPFLANPQSCVLYPFSFFLAVGRFYARIQA